MKAIFPSFQRPLQECHSTLGLPQPATKIKEHFAYLEMKNEGISKHSQDLIKAILTEIDFNQEAQEAFKDNLIDLSSGYTELFSKTCTYKTNQKTVIWHLLGYFFVPYMARRVTFWNLNILASLDKGIPRGRF